MHLHVVERKTEERCEEIENRARRNNLRIYGVPENFESGDTIEWVDKFLKELLHLLDDLDLQIERAHRSLLPKTTDLNAPPRSLVV